MGSKYLAELRKLKKSIEYDPNIPRCETCVNFCKSKKVIVNSIPRLSPAKCIKYSFIINKNGLCNSWVHKVTKEILE